MSASASPLTDGAEPIQWEWAGFAQLPKHIVREATWYDRERTLPALFEDVPEGGIVWMSFANAAFETLAYNWAAHVYMLRKEKQLVLASLDGALQVQLQHHRLPFFSFNAAGTTSADLRSNVTEFRRMGALKGELLLTVLSARRNVLLSDVDVIWLVDPEPLLRTLWEADVMSATDCLSPNADDMRAPPPERQRQGVNRCAYAAGNSLGHAAFNTGVVFFRDTAAAKAVAVAWRRRLLAEEKNKWLDDQLAFNEILWTGYRAHKGNAVAKARKDGKVIRIRLAGPMTTPGGSVLVTPRADETWPELDPDTQTAATGQFTGFAQAIDLGWRSAWSELLATASIAPEQKLPAGFNFAPLPARQFCAGHTFWVQQGGVEGNSDCFSVHTTFTEGGYKGKEWRFRDAAHWLLDRPEYHAPSRNYLSFTPPQPPAELPIQRNKTAPRTKNDKYEAGWLVPDALRQSPRLQAHLELVRRHLLALRDALALARILNRTLILPALPCLCDRSEGPSIIPGCTFEASDLTLPYFCPIAQIVDLPRFLAMRPRASGGVRGPGGLLPGLLPARATPAAEWRGIELRESAFLRNPRTHATVTRGEARVRVARDAPHAGELRAAGELVVLEGSSDAQLRAGLGAHAAPRLHLESAEGVFGGWTDDAHHRDFETLIAHHLSGGSWCCSSWYKPSGSFDWSFPAPTTLLRDGCGSASSEAPEAPHCTQARRTRRHVHQKPLHFFGEGDEPDRYVPGKGRLGDDGYYVLERASTAQS